MLQPFEKFKPIYLNRLIILKKFYLVSQTYTRVQAAAIKGQKPGLLFTEYDDAGLASIHVNALKHDKLAAIADLSNVNHLARITAVLQADSPYEVYWSIVKDLKALEQNLTKKYTNNMRRFVMNNTNWRIGADDKIMPSMQVTFGELFIILKRGNQTLRVKFEEIEKA